MIYLLFILLSCAPILSASDYKLIKDREIISRPRHTEYDFDHYMHKETRVTDYNSHIQPDTFGRMHVGIGIGIRPETHDNVRLNTEAIGKACAANQVMHTDYQARSIKEFIDRQLLEINKTLGSPQATTAQRFAMVQNIELLTNAFDTYYQTLLQKSESMQRMGFVGHDIQRDLYAVASLKEELHNLLNSIKIEFFDKKGAFLNKDPDSLLWNRMRIFFHDKTVKSYIATYGRQYDQGYVRIIAKPDHNRLERIENHPFNKALETFSGYLKQGNLDQAQKICATFKKQKRLMRTLNSFKASSEYLNQYGLPRVWQESHPDWHVYEAELTFNPGKLNEITTILQQDHNKAYGLCAQADIDMPTVTQLNRAHQLNKYEHDPAFGDIAIQSLQDSRLFKVALQNLEQRAAALEHIQGIVLHNPDNLLLLQEHLNDLILYEQDPTFAQTITHMVNQPEKIDGLKQELLQRDTYVQEMYKLLGRNFLPEYTRRIAYCLAEARDDNQRIETLSALSIDHPDIARQEAYNAFHDAKTHLPKIFRYNRQLLKNPLPACIATQDFWQERACYTHVMKTPITSDAQRIQAEQCLSFLQKACTPGKLQNTYRDLACTAAKTYIQQLHNSMPADRMQQVKLFAQACKEIEQNVIAGSMGPSSPMQHAQPVINYQHLYDHAAKQCTTLQNNIGHVPGYYSSREQALKEIMQGNGTIYTKTYVLSSQAIKVLEKYDIDPAQFTHCIGNAVQQDTNAKLVDTLNTLTQKTASTSSLQQIKDGVIECAQASNHLNQAGNVQEAMLLSDICHVAVEYLWQGIDTSLAIGKGVAEGVYLGVSSEITDMLRDPRAPQETYLRAGEFTEPNLTDRVTMETATAVAEFLRLIRDSAEVLASGVAGVGDAVVGLPDLARDCVAVTKLTGQCAWHITCEMAELAYQAECMNQVKFDEQLHKIQQECGQVAQGISSYLKELTACKKKHNGTISKEELKEYARSGGRFVTEGIITSQVLKGTTKIMKGASSYIKSVRLSLTKLENISEISTQIVGESLSIASNVNKTIDIVPEIGSKLKYLFGKAAGNLHNIERSTTMAKQLSRIGIFDDAKGCHYLVEHLAEVLNNPSSCVKIQDNGRVLRESLLMGPTGGLKMQSVWDGNRLITVELFG